MGGWMIPWLWELDFAMRRMMRFIYRQRWRCEDTRFADEVVLYGLCTYAAFAFIQIA